MALALCACKKLEPREGLACLSLAGDLDPWIYKEEPLTSQAASTLQYRAGD
jgi:hypothetical protein